MKQQKISVYLPSEAFTYTIKNQEQVCLCDELTNEVNMLVGPATDLVEGESVAYAAVLAALIDVLGDSSNDFKESIEKLAMQKATEYSVNEKKLARFERAIKELIYD